MRNISPCEILTPICIWVADVIHRYTVDRYIILNSSTASRNKVIIILMVKWATKDLDNHI